MATYTLSGNDTVIFNQTVFEDFPNGKIVEVSWDDTLVEQKVGKNGNIISVYKPSGKKAKVVLRLLRSSADDILVNSKLEQMSIDFPSFKLLTLTLNKRFGDGAGNVKNDTMILTGGLIGKVPAISTDIDGDTEQSVISYEMTFGSFVRTIS